MGTFDGQVASGDDDAIGARERLIGQVIQQIDRQGYFVAYLDPQPAQAIIDVRWAAQLAGRAIDRQLRTYASAVGTKQPRKVTVVVAPTEVWSRSLDDVESRDRTRVLIEDLLAVHHAMLRRGPISA